MLKKSRWFGVLALASLAVASVQAQEFPKPGPEHEVLKQLVGTWDTTMKFGGGEAKGVVTAKMDLGGMWMVSSLESELFGQKYFGKGMDSYDATKKKYIGIWVDSMSASPMVMEGDYDKAKKTLTLAGQGPGMDGKPTKYKSTSEFTDENTMNFTMYMGDQKEPAFSIVYKRRK